MTRAADSRKRRRLPGRQRLLGEFLLLFWIAPVGVAVFLPPAAVVPALAAFTALGIVLLQATPGFCWRGLLRNPQIPAWPVLALAAATLAVSVAVVWLSRPDDLFWLVRERPGLLLAVVLLYPLLSALPQELLYRALFFRRYRVLLPRGNAGLVFNAAAFSLAHLPFWNWTVAVLSFAGGLVFGWAYHRRGSFLLAVVLHALAGAIVFVAGMGAFFYTGMVERPF